MKKVLKSRKEFISFQTHFIRFLFAFLLIGSSVYATPLITQPPTITGKVTSDEGEGLPGVSIVVKGTTVGTTTDINGNFTLDLPASATTLVFSFIGYITEEVAIANQTNFTIKLTPNLETLSEVVVVGYGTQKKENLTGAISAVKGKEFVKSPQPNLSNSFAGRISGMVANTGSGEPGYDASRILIRGQSTTGDNSPLIVIDGVANRLGGLDRLDPNDIESISVLKDASAAIYGSQAANGVILVTTKRGTKGKPVFNFSYNQGFAQSTRLPQMADAPTYAQIQNEIEYYKNPTDGLNQIYTADEIQKFSNGSDPINYPNTDWIHEVVKPVALQDQQNLSINGGGENVSYFVSLGRRNQQGIYKNTNLKFEQYNLRTNLDLQLTKDLKVGLDLAVRNEDRVFPTSGAGSIFRFAYRSYPTLAASYPGAGPSPGIEDGNNPTIMGTGQTGYDKQPVTVFNGLLNFQYNIPFVKGLSVKGFYAEDRGFASRKLFRKPWTVYQKNTTNGETTFDPVKRGPVTPELTQRQINSKLRTANVSLNYEKQIGKSSITTFIAYEQNAVDSSRVETFRRGFLSSSIDEIDLGGSAPEETTNSGNSNRFTRKNYFGRLTYGFSDKYFAEVQFRYDGSSRFPKGNQYGFFPSISGGWRISNESWFAVEKINNLKLRASYGLLGNDRIKAFQYSNLFSLRSAQYVLDGTPVPTLAISQLANPDITWETAKKFDFGVEIGFLRMFTLEFDYFNERREDLLVPRTGSVPAVSGIVNEYGEPNIIPDENLGKVKNSGFETQLGFNKTVGDLNITLGGNFTYNKSEVIFLDDAAGIPDYQKRAGRPLGSQLLYKTKGIYKTSEDLDTYPGVPGHGLGDLIIEDVNGDGTINANDRVRESLSNVPQIIYGFSGGLNYKDFDFSFLLQGQARSVQYVLTEAGTVGNYFDSWASNRWSPNNPDGTYPRVDVRTSSSINGGLYRNDFWLYNTSFFRIKNVELGYNLPEGIASKLRLKGARIYVNGLNLATISKVKDFDPEGQSESAQFYPQQRIYNIGVNIKF